MLNIEFQSVFYLNNKGVYPAALLFETKGLNIFLAIFFSDLFLNFIFISLYLLSIK